MERYLRVNLLGPGPRLMKKEFTRPRSHKGWETLVYDTGLLTECIKHSRTTPVYKDSVNDTRECEDQTPTTQHLYWTTEYEVTTWRPTSVRPSVHASDNNKLQAAEAEDPLICLQISAKVHALACLKVTAWSFQNRLDL